MMDDKKRIFRRGEWYPMDTLPNEYRTSQKPFKAKQGKCAPFSAWYRNNRFEPVGDGSYYPTHWSPCENSQTAVEDEEYYTDREPGLTAEDREYLKWLKDLE